VKLDTIHLVETPEGIDLHAELTGLLPRALAYSLDFLIRSGLIFALFLVFIWMGKTGYGFWLILFFLLEWLYPVVFEVYRGGQTIGKKSFHIKVVNEDLTPVKLGASLTRNLLRVADFFPIFYVFGMFSLLITTKFQRLGDLAAGTIVIYEDKRKYDFNLAQDIVPIASNLDLNEAQQSAFVSFALNRSNLSKARQQEIAEIIQPVIPKKYSDPVKYIKGVGKWLLGVK